MSETKKLLPFQDVFAKVELKEERDTGNKQKIMVSNFYNNV